MEYDYNTWLKKYAPTLPVNKKQSWIFNLRVWVYRLAGHFIVPDASSHNLRVAKSLA